MKSFEEYLASENYNTAREARAAKKRKFDRQITREEAKLKRYLYSVIVSAACFLTLVAIVIIYALLDYADAKEPLGGEISAMESVSENKNEKEATEYAALPQEDYENAMIEQALLEKATMIPDMTITHYCICESCCGKSTSDPAYGITASGREATPYVSVAVDTDVIPLGADVLVDYGDGEIHYYRADDTGSAINGNHIDLCVESHQEALNMGVKTATVYWVMPDGID